MYIMLLSMGILFGGIFGYQMFRGYMIKKYMANHVPPPVSVSSLVAEYQPWQTTLHAIGTLRAYRGVDVSTEVAGTVRSIEFTSGAQATANQLLITLIDDAETAQLQTFQAAAELAQINYERDKKQFSASAISKSTLDASLANVKSTKGQVNQQLAIIAKKNIRAPFAGKLGITTINPGEYLKPGDKIVTLQALDPIFVDFFLPQQNVPKISPGQSVSITSDLYPGKVFEGTISSINPLVDAATRNVHIEARINNSEYKLLPGTFANIDIQIGKAQPYITVPQTAVSFNPYGNMVFIAEKTPQGLIAVHTPVTLGERRGDQIAIVKGIREKDLVITSGQMKLKNKMPIVINNAIVPSNDANPTPTDL